MTVAADKNPANKQDLKLETKKRIPMSVPQQNLEVSDIPGYHLHWFLTSNVHRAQRAGYTFVTLEDGVDLNNFDLAGKAEDNGSSDLGSAFSVPAAKGGDSEERLYLMKLPLEYWAEDQERLEARNEQIAAALRGGRDASGGNPDDVSNRYIPNHMKNQMANMFTPKRR